MPARARVERAVAHRVVRREPVELLGRVLLAQPPRHLVVAKHASAPPRGLAAHKQALTNMRDAAIATTNNTYEIDWLSYRLRTLESIGAGG